jgi:hypothetical protein
MLEKDVVVLAVAAVVTVSEEPAEIEDVVAEAEVAAEMARTTRNGFLLPS